MTGRTLIAAAVLLPLVLIPPAYRQFHARCFDEDLPITQVAAFHDGDGVDATDEYTPRTADNNALADSVYPSWLSDDPSSLIQYPESQNGSIDFNTAQSFHIPAMHANFLVLRLRNYPAWQVRVNGAPAQLVPRPDGYLAIELPPGESDVTVRYRILPDEVIGVLISLIALILFLLLHRRARHRGMNALSMPIKPSSPFMPAALPT